MREIKRTDLQKERQEKADLQLVADKIKNVEVYLEKKDSTFRRKDR